MLLVVSSGVRADAQDTGVAIRVYDGAGLDAASLQDAIREASAIVADTGIAADWRDCTPRPKVARCDQARGDQDLIIRVLPAFVPATGPGALLTSVGSRRYTLGHAVVVPETGTGVLGSVFLDHIVALGERVRVSQAAILGRAMAHEVGHLLLGTRGHSEAGLMRALWTDAELTADRTEDWLFAPADRDLLRRRYPHAATGD